MWENETAPSSHGSSPPDAVDQTEGEAGLGILLKGSLSLACSPDMTQLACIVSSGRVANKFWSGNCAPHGEAIGMVPEIPVSCTVQEIESILARV